MDAILVNLNTSKVFAGMSMLMLNMGSRFLAADIKPAQERLLSNGIVKRIILF